MTVMSLRNILQSPPKVTPQSEASSNQQICKKYYIQKFHRLTVIPIAIWCLTVKAHLNNFGNTLILFLQHFRHLRTDLKPFSIQIYREAKEMSMMIRVRYFLVIRGFAHNCHISLSAAEMCGASIVDAALGLLYGFRGRSMDS